jgi:hypothetical protein
LMMLIADFADVAFSTTMDRGWFVNTRGHLEDALAAAQGGDSGQAQQSLGLFVQNITQSSTAPADISRLTTLANRTMAALACEPAGPASRRSANSRRSFRLPQQSVIPQGRMRESRWIEFDGTRYRPDDPRLHELQLEQLEQNLDLFLGGDGG